MLASTRKNPAFSDVAMTMQRLCGSRGGAARPDILAPEDAEKALGSDASKEACAAYREAKKQGMGERKEDGMPKKRGDIKRVTAKRRMGLIVELD